jgi:hypothetical protein
VEPGKRLHVAEPAPVRTASTHRRKRSSAQTGSTATKSGNGPGAAESSHKPASSAPKSTHRQASNAPAHATKGATHKSRSRAKPPQQ